MNSGYDIFGTAYGVMFRHDLHAPGSVDDLFLQRMCLLEEESVDALYAAPPVISPAITMHELYPFAQQFVGMTLKEVTHVPSGATPENNQIDAIAGATITTDAVLTGVNGAIEYYNSNIQKGE